MRRDESGLTLIEVMIGVVLMLIILAVAYPGFITASGTMSVSARQARLQEAGEKVTKQLVDLFRLGQMQEIGAAGAAPFAIVHPPRTGIALDEITLAGAVPWKEDAIRIRFRQTDVVDEAKIGSDLNGDRDWMDRFALGVIEVVTPDGARPITRLGRVMLGLPTYQGDVDGDGEDDPLFEVTDRRLDLKLAMVFREESGEFRKAALSRSLYLRNRQD